MCSFLFVLQFMAGVSNTWPGGLKPPAKGLQSLVSTSSKSPGLLALHHLLLHISLNSTKHNLFIF